MNSPIVSAPQPHSLSKRKRTIIGVTIAALLLVAAAACTYAYMWYQSPERIILSAVLNTANSPSTGFNGTVASTAATMAVNGRMVDDKVAATGDGSITVGDAKINLKADAMLIGDKTYVKSDQLSKVIPQAFGVEGNAMVVNALGVIDEAVNSRWVELDSNSSQILSGGDKSSACLVDFMQKVAPSQAAKSQLVDLYRQNPFIVIATKSHDSQSAVYNLSIDLEKFVAFKIALKDTELHQTMISCTNDTPIMTEEQAKNLSIQLTVDTQKMRISHVLLNSDNSTTKIDMALSYDGIRSIAAPSDSVKVSELRTEVLRGFMTQQLRQFMTR